MDSNIAELMKAKREAENRVLEIQKTAQSLKDPDLVEANRVWNEARKALQAAQCPNGGA